MHSLLGSCRQALLYIQKNDHHPVRRLFQELYACMSISLFQLYIQRLHPHWGLAANFLLLLQFIDASFSHHRCTFVAIVHKTITASNPSKAIHPYDRLDKQGLYADHQLSVAADDTGVTVCCQGDS